MHSISSIQVKQQRLLRICYKQNVHIFTGMSYQLKVTIKQFDFRFCNEMLSIFIIEKRDENKVTDKLILSLEVICKAKELYIFVNKLSFSTVFWANLQTTSSNTYQFTLYIIPKQKNK